MSNPTKSIRMSDEARKLLKLLAAYEDRNEGELVEDALTTYLQVRAISYGNELPEIRELVDLNPESAGEVVERLQAVIAKALTNGQRAPRRSEARARLASKAAKRRRKAAGSAPAR